MYLWVKSILTIKLSYILKTNMKLIDFICFKQFTTIYYLDHVKFYIIVFLNFLIRFLQINNTANCVFNKTK